MPSLSINVKILSLMVIFLSINFVWLKFYPIFAKKLNVNRVQRYEK